MKQAVITGNQAVAHAVRLSRVQVVSAYPITPQTTVMETLAEMHARGDFKGEYVSVESENSAMAYCIGAAYAGARTFTATSSHGLAYMHELLHWAAGARLPLVLTNANRAMGAPWCIESDQLDSLSQRDTGWIQFYCTSVQEILDNVILAFRLAEESRLPVMVCYDGFYLSHTYEAVKIPGQSEADSFLRPPADHSGIDLQSPQNVHALVNSEAMSRLVNSRFQTTEMVSGKYRTLAEEFLKVFGRNYPAVEYSGSRNARTILVTAGGMCQTVRSFLSGGREEALVCLRQFRPFPFEEVCQILGRPHVERVVVIDRNVSMGVGGIFAQELRAAMYGRPFQPKILELNLAGGLDLTPEILEKTLAGILAGDNSRITWAVNL